MATRRRFGDVATLGYNYKHRRPDGQQIGAGVFSIAVEYKDTTDIVPVGPFDNTVEALSWRDVYVSQAQAGHISDVVRVYIVYGERVPV